MITEKEIEFLKESNGIESEYSYEALEDAKQAWKFAKANKYNINKIVIKRIHFELLKRLNPSIAGKIRGYDVWVGGRKGIGVNKIKGGLELLCDLKLHSINNENFIKQWHIQFEKIHPFGDGNGRTGRILMNIQRLRIGLPILIIHEGEEQMKYYKWFK